MPYTVGDRYGETIVSVYPKAVKLWVYNMATLKAFWFWIKPPVGI